MSAGFDAPLGLDELKKQRLIQALREASGNQSEAAKLLGISRTSVWNQMKRFNLGAKPGEKKLLRH